MTNRHDSRPQSNPRSVSGSVLLFSLLVMSAVLIGSIGLSALIMDSLRQTKLIDLSTVAYYAAEAGVEEGLYNARRTGVLPDSQAVPTHGLPFGVSYRSQVSALSEVLFATIPKDEFIEINLYDPDAPSLATGLDYVRVSWSEEPPGGSMVVASMVSWRTDTLASGWDPSMTTFKYPCCTVDIPMGSPNMLHKLRLRAKNATLQNVTVRGLHDDGGTLVPEPMPGRVEIAATGQLLDVRRRLVATMPRGEPLSGLYDFVIFSECSIVKGGRPISCP